MAQVWVQAWTARVPGSVAVEQSVLAQVAGLENLLPLVPMLVQVKEKEWELAPSVLVKESPLVQVAESVSVSETATAQELARAEELLEVLEPWRD